MARVALVLGAGGLVGHAYHAGTLRALADHGWDARSADVVVGTSAGSGIGALLRAGLPPRDFAARVLGQPLTPEGQRIVAAMPPPVRSVPLTPGGTGGRPAPASPELLMRSALQPWRWRPGHLMAGGLPAGTQPTAIIGERVRAAYGARSWPAEPLWICALRLRDGGRTVFGQAGAPPIDIATAVEASSAIPGVFEPVAVGGERYVDGGAHSPTNADLVARGGFDVIVVVSPMSTRSDASPTMATAGRWWWHRQLRRELAPARSSGVRVVTIEPGPDDLAAMGQTLNAMDGRRMGEVAHQAERSAALLLAGQAPLA